MSTNGKVKEESYKEIKSILISQPKPERSPYYDLEKKYNLQIDWRQFIQVEPVTEKEFIVVIYPLKKFRHYITCYKVFVHTDHFAI